MPLCEPVLVLFTGDRFAWVIFNLSFVLDRAVLKVMSATVFEKHLKAASDLGLVRDGEARLLYDIARGLPSGAVAAEIGSWMGKSATAIALGLKAVNGTLHTIDDHRGVAGATDLPTGDKAREMFLKNLEAAGVRDRIEHHALSSDDLAPSWDTLLDFLFIDGNHEYKAARRDIFNYAPFVKPGGWIAFHDVGMKDDVFRAIEEWIDDRHIQISSMRFNNLVMAIRLPLKGEKTFGQIRMKLLRFGVPHACRALPPKNKPIHKLAAKVRQSVARRIVRTIGTKG